MCAGPDIDTRTKHPFVRKCIQFIHYLFVCEQPKGSHPNRPSTVNSCGSCMSLEYFLFSRQFRLCIHWHRMRLTWHHLYTAHLHRPNSHQCRPSANGSNRKSQNFDLLVENCACWSVIIECMFELAWGWRIDASNAIAHSHSPYVYVCVRLSSAGFLHYKNLHIYLIFISTICA